MVTLRNKYTHQLSRFWTVILLGLLTLAQFPVGVLAQTTAVNEINFQIPSVTKDGQKINTTKVSATRWQLVGDTKLDLDDGIRYSWAGVDIDLKYKELPSQYGGYLKIYRDNDTKEDNFILDYGAYSSSSVGLKMSDLKSKLTNGENTLMFVFIGYNNLNPVAKAKVQFTFQFENSSSDPTIDIKKPDTGVVLAENIYQTFEIEMNGFTLENSDSGQANYGKMNVYYNEVTQGSLLGTITTSLEIDGKQKVTFSTKDFGNFSTIPDNLKTEIIFVLTKNNGELLPYRQSLEVITNYKNSLDVGLPRVTILEPNRDRADMQISGNQKFVLRIDNFEITDKEQSSGNQKGKGYLQIILNNRAVELTYGKSEFTLNEIGASQFGEGSLNVKVQLVNYDFTKLNPEASDSIEVFFVPQNSNQSSEIQQVENNTWRFVIMGLIVVLVVGSISILITRG